MVYMYIYPDLVYHTYLLYMQFREKLEEENNNGEWGIFFGEKELGRMKPVIFNTYHTLKSTIIDVVCCVHI